TRRIWDRIEVKLLPRSQLFEFDLGRQIILVREVIAVVCLKKEESSVHVLYRSNHDGGSFTWQEPRRSVSHAALAGSLDASSSYSLSSSSSPSSSSRSAAGLAFAFLTVRVFALAFALGAAVLPSARATFADPSLTIWRSLICVCTFGFWPVTLFSPSFIAASTHSST